MYLELLRRGYEVTVGRTGDKGIDFVCDKRGEKLYVQVTYLLASEETVNREFGAYDNVCDNFPKYVVSLDEFDRSRNLIKQRFFPASPLVSFLWQKSSVGSLLLLPLLQHSRTAAQRAVLRLLAGCARLLCESGTNRRHGRDGMGALF